VTQPLCLRPNRFGGLPLSRRRQRQTALGRRPTRLGQCSGMTPGRCDVDSGPQER
jgi:hypothetical protein